MRWDVLLISKTGRQRKDVWETQQGHIVVESGMFTNKHGVDGRIRSIGSTTRSERVVAASISGQQTNDNLGECVHATQWLSGPSSCKNIQKRLVRRSKKDKSMKIIGGDFNAELGLGVGIELSSVGHYALKKSKWKRRMNDTVVTWNNLVALNTMYKKLRQRQVIHHTPKGVKKQLDYILTDKTWLLEQRRRGQRYNWHGKRQIRNSKAKRKPRRNEAPPTDLDKVTCEDEHELK